jgi:hypothetical protein
VRVPSLYNHVAGLPGLKRDLAVYCLGELTNTLTRAVMGKARTDAIFALADAFRAYAHQAPARYTLTLQAPALDDTAWQELGRQSVDAAAAVLAPYGLNEEATIHAIRGLRSIVQGFITLEMAGAFAISLSTEQSFHWLVQLYADGLERLAHKQA